MSTKKGKKLTQSQKEAVKSWESICGIPMMHLDEVKDGTMTFYEAFHNNLAWAENMLASLSHIKFELTMEDWEYIDKH